MKVYQGHSASPGLVLGQVSRVERRTESFRPGPFSPEREQRLLDNAVNRTGHLSVPEHDAGGRGLHE